VPSEQEPRVVPNESVLDEQLLAATPEMPVRSETAEATTTKVILCRRESIEPTISRGWESLDDEDLTKSGIRIAWLGEGRRKFVDEIVIGVVTN
jgi:hypothetical protein